MEQTAGYKNVEERIKLLEQKLKKCSKAVQECEESGGRAAKEIEEQFAKCINALAARKAILFEEVEARIAKQKQKIQESQAQMVTSIEACKQTLKGCAMMYAVNKPMVEGFLQQLAQTVVPNVNSLSVMLQFPASLCETIQNYGKVIDSSRFSTADRVTTFAGSISGDTDGNGVKAKFSYPWGMCFNPLDNCFYVCDSDNNAIRKLSMQGNVNTLAKGNGLNYPTGIVFNSKENVFFVANFHGHTVLKVTIAGAVSVFAGSGKFGKADGNGTSASFYNPSGITIDPVTGVLFVCDTGNHSIRKISPQGEVTTLAGSTYGYSDGNKNNSKFGYPWGICFSEDDQSVLVCDNSNDKLRKVLMNGDVSTLCDVPCPTSVVITSNKTVLVTSAQNKVFKVTFQGQQNYVTELLAGTGASGKVDGMAEECSFNKPYGIAVHEASRSCFVSDWRNHTIRKISFVNTE